MDQLFKQDTPYIAAIAGFLVLMLFSHFIQKIFRRKHLVHQGQILPDGQSPKSIEQRVSANTAWAKGEIKSKGKMLVAVVWLLALVWNLTMGVGFFKSLSNPEMKTAPLIVLGIFASLGLVPIFFAIRLSIRQFRFGESLCRINGKAGVIGKTMTGNVRTLVEVQPEGDYTIVLECIESIQVGSGKNSRTDIRNHWHSQQIVPHAGKSSRVGIPFSFEIPKHPPETACQLAVGAVSWQLKISAPTVGVDYAALFVVPVFDIQ